MLQVGSGASRYPTSRHHDITTAKLSSHLPERAIFIQSCYYCEWLSIIKTEQG
ncbi:hypothetical protein HMPREF1570_4277 [Klebsiella oxytoca KA-2]|nr:hypothetical protein HMPREF1570_4277 [Klebsiella oxytoca KA-2]